jgi:hypothetical protein
MAITSLVLGIVALPAICCYGLPAVVLGTVAVILGRMSIGKIRASGGTLGGNGLAQAGWITGLIAACLGFFYMLFTVGMLVLSLALGSSGGVPSPTP